MTTQTSREASAWIKGTTTLAAGLLVAAMMAASLAPASPARSCSW